MHRFYSIIKITLPFFFIILNTSHNLNAQQNEDDFWNSVRFGGGIGLGFSDGFFSATLAPSAIYEFNDQVALGLGLNGTYSSEKNIYKSSILGGSIIGLFNPINEIQLSAEFEELNVNRKWEDNLGVADENYWVPALFLGAGYRNGNFTLGLRYDLLYNEDKSIYSNALLPFIRFYF